MGYWKKALPSFLWNPLNEIRRDYFPEFKKSYSGEGEDLVLAKIFNNRTQGFYVDIGCYHPKVNSNTYYFYRKGWQGVNIDANPDSILKFNKFRKRDININMGISHSENTMTYHRFSESAVNTFSEEMYKDRLKVPGLKYLGASTIPVKPLADVLRQHNVRREIDFFDIDVEGFDMEVLQSNDWEQYLPKVVMVEDQVQNVRTFEDLETYRFLSPKGYRLLAKTYSTLIFIHEKQLK